MLTYANNIKMKPLWGIRSWVYRVSLKFTHNYFKKENQNEKGSLTLKRISRYHFWFSPRIHVGSITPYKAQMIILWLLVVLVAVLHIRTLRTYPISGINWTTKLIVPSKLNVSNQILVNDACLYTRNQKLCFKFQISLSKLNTNQKLVDDDSWLMTWFARR